MLRVRPKMSPETPNWSCCFGLHVRTATIVIGLWHLFLNMTILALLAVIIRHPEMMQNMDGDNELAFQSDFDVPALPTPQSKIEPPFAYHDRSMNYQNMDVGGLACVCMIAITLFMIYGAAKGKPSHLLPFFCIQLFDFAITTLTAAGYICYLRSVHRIVSDSPRLPWRDYLLKLSPNTLAIVVMVSFICTVALKAYVIGIVWRCYKYLAMRQHNMRSMLPYIIPDVTPRQERDYNTLLPGYEEAIAQSMKQQPPPSYQVAMAASSPLTPSAGAESATTLTGVTVILPPPSATAEAQSAALPSPTTAAVFAHPPTTTATTDAPAQAPAAAQS